MTVSRLHNWRSAIQNVLPVKGAAFKIALAKAMGGESALTLQTPIGVQRAVMVEWLS